MRRIARQSRSRATVSAIEQAAALIVEAGDSASFTTNHIAERAGVSIGSLYEYFASKDDILRSFSELEADAMRNELEAIWRAGKSGDEQKLDLAMILALPLAPFKSRPALANAMLRQFAQSPWALELAQRQLGRLIDVIGDRGTTSIFGMTSDQVKRRTPTLAARLAAQIVELKQSPAAS